MEFVEKHWWLVLIVVISGSMLVWSFIGGVITAVKWISVAQAVELINRQEALVLDIRDSSAFANGHILRAKNIPRSQLAERVTEIEKDKKRPIIITCQMGNDSVTACASLRKMGFSSLFALKGGIQSWIQTGMPIEK